MHKLQTDEKDTTQNNGRWCRLAIKDRQGHHQAQMVKEQGGKRDFGATG